MKSREADIQDVAADEKNRGSRRNPRGPEAHRQHAKRVRQCKKLLRVSTEEEFVGAMRDAGLRDDSEQMMFALRLWRENRW